MSTPCYGQSRLFDSTEPADHRKARDICAGCPAAQFAACHETAKTLRDKEGTWAGKLYGDIGPLRRAREDARFSDQDAQLAHAAFNRGARDEETRAGNRVYERRKVAARRARRAAA